MARSRPPSGKGGRHGESRPPSRRARGGGGGAPRKRNYKAEYERRKALGLALGRSVQASRGHLPGEHLLRKMDPELRRAVRAAMREQARREIELKKRKAEIERTAAIKDLYKRLQNIFAVMDEEDEAA